MARFLVAGPVFRAACLFFVTITTVSHLAAEEPATGSTENLLGVLDRKIVLERDEWLYWQVDYRLRVSGPGGVEPESRAGGRRRKGLGLELSSRSPCLPVRVHPRSHGRNRLESKR